MADTKVTTLPDLLDTFLTVVKPCGCMAGATCDPTPAGLAEFFAGWPDTYTVRDITDQDEFRALTNTCAVCRPEVSA